MTREPRSIIRDRPGPEAYGLDEIVEVKLRPAPGVEPRPFRARVIRRSRTHLHVRVLGSGTKIALTRWDVKCFVRREGEIVL